MRVVDFFCGGGGFSEGFRQAGFQILVAVDTWSPAVITYKANKPNVHVIQEDVIRISMLPDKEFHELIPDSEVIIGSPPCQAFSQSNKSGKADKSLGIKLIKAYLRIIARKKYRLDSRLKYWVLENVPNVKKYIKEEYTAGDLGLDGTFILRPCDGASGIYNAKYFGAPTNRKRYLCGEFPKPVMTHNDENAVTLRAVLESLGNPLGEASENITDVNYPGLSLPRSEVSDHGYVHELAPFEWKTAKRLKQDRGYMGKMAFPENIDKPSRTVMATMSASSREAMIIGFGNDKYRLPTVRETASMMSFPIDYRFYGRSKGIKHTLVGNAVPPKLSYAIARAIALDAHKNIPNHYIPIHHSKDIAFVDLNGMNFPIKIEGKKRSVSRFKYHIPYLIYASYRVELTNYHSDFDYKKFIWDVEIHYSQGKEKANKFVPNIGINLINIKYRASVLEYLNKFSGKSISYNRFQELFCMTHADRLLINAFGPYELLDDVRNFIDGLLSEEEQKCSLYTETIPQYLPQAIIVGYFILKQIVKYMGDVR